MTRDSLKTQLDQIVAKYNLLEHPFYESWRAGTLPVDALAVYAREYGALIKLMPSGWAVQEDEHTAEEEREHIELWQQFAAALNTKAGSGEISEVKSMVSATRRLFADPATAQGALYAFESQQPPTAHSKLEGLRAHYQLPSAVEPYFKEHSHNEHEAEKLLDRLAEQQPAEQKRALKACQEMAQSLWDALSGIHRQTVPQNI